MSKDSSEDAANADLDYEAEQLRQGYLTQYQLNRIARTAYRKEVPDHLPAERVLRYRKVEATKAYRNATQILLSNAVRHVELLIEQGYMD